MEWSDIKKASEFGNIEEFEALDYDSKWEYIAEWMAEVAKDITLLARKVGSLQGSINKDSGRLKGVVKGLGKNRLLRDILKGEVDSTDLFSKERDVLKRYTKDLEAMYIV